MNVALYEAKSKFSEYVNLAEQGEVIEVCKYGKPSVVIVDAKEYFSKEKPKVSRFDLWYSAWRKEFDEVLESEKTDDADEFYKNLENARSECNGYRPNPFELQGRQ